MPEKTELVTWQLRGLVLNDLLSSPRPPPGNEWFHEVFPVPWLSAVKAHLASQNPEGSRTTSLDRTRQFCGKEWHKGQAWEDLKSWCCVVWRFDVLIRYPPVVLDWLFRAVAPNPLQYPMLHCSGWTLAVWCPKSRRNGASVGPQEEEYHQHIQKHRFGDTRRKGGFDCLRHWVCHMLGHTFFRNHSMLKCYNFNWDDVDMPQKDTSKVKLMNCHQVVGNWM